MCVIIYYCIHFIYDYFLYVCMYVQVRKLEAEGVPSKQAESITSCITQVLNDTLENVADSFVSKAEMEKVCIFFLILWSCIYCIDLFCKFYLGFNNTVVCIVVQIVMTQDAHLSKFKSEVTSSQVCYCSGSIF